MLNGPRICASPSIWYAQRIIRKQTPLPGHLVAVWLIDHVQHNPAFGLRDLCQHACHQRCPVADERLQGQQLSQR